MSKPVVAIVGRPNVGKSSLFNTLYGERISIVHDTPGVTRDRIYATAVWREREFTMIHFAFTSMAMEQVEWDTASRLLRISTSIALNRFL